MEEFLHILKCWASSLYLGQHLSLWILCSLPIHQNIMPPTQWPDHVKVKIHLHLQAELLSLKLSLGNSEWNSIEVFVRESWGQWRFSRLKVFRMDKSGKDWRQPGVPILPIFICLKKHTIHNNKKTFPEWMSTVLSLRKYSNETLKSTSF